MRRAVLCSPTTLAGLSGSALLLVLALVGPSIVPYSVDAGQVIAGQGPLLAGPSFHHPMGTDWFGMDVFSRVLAGARATVVIGLASSAATVAIGILVGLTAGFFGGLYDAFWMRVVDVVMAFPSLLLAILIAATMEPSLASLFLALVLVSWAGPARLVRSLVLAMRRQDFVLAAATIGASPGRILAQHVLPNIAPTLLVIFTSRIGTMILSEASLNFLGLGAPVAAPSWGVMVYYGMDHLSDGPWCALCPATAIALTVLAFNFLGDGLRDLIDPRLDLSA